MATKKENKKRQKQYFHNELVDLFLQATPIQQRPIDPRLQLMAETFRFQTGISVSKFACHYDGAHKYSVYDGQGNCYGMFMAQRPNDTNWESPSECLVYLVMQRKYGKSLVKVIINSCVFDSEQSKRKGNLSLEGEVYYTLSLTDSAEGAILDFKTGAEI